MHAGTAEPLRVSPPEAVAYLLELRLEPHSGPRSRQQIICRKRDRQGSTNDDSMHFGLPAVTEHRKTIRYNHLWLTLQQFPEEPKSEHSLRHFLTLPSPQAW